MHDVGWWDAWLPRRVEAEVVVKFLEVQGGDLFRKASLDLEPNVQMELHPPHHKKWDERVHCHVGFKVGGSCLPRSCEGVKFCCEMVSGSEARVEEDSVAIQHDGDLDACARHPDLFASGQGHW